MVDLTTSLPYASFYGQGHGDQLWTKEIPPEFYVQRIAQMIYNMLHIQGSQLLRWVRVEPMGGEKTGFRRRQPLSTSRVTNRYRMQVTKPFYDFMAAVAASTSTTTEALAALEAFQQPTGDIRWCYPQIIKYNPVIGTVWDPLFGPITPSNEFVQEGIGAIGRAWDRVIVDAFFGNAIEGHNAAENTTGALSTVEWSESNSDCTILKPTGGLTRSAIQKVAEFFDDRGIPNDPSQRIAIIGVKQKQDILNSSEFTSTDWRASRPLENNEIGGLMGFTWVVIGNDLGVAGEDELLPKISGLRRCIFTSPRTLGFGIWDRFQSRAYEIENNDFAKAIWISSTVGATRIEERTMVEVRCQETS